MKIMIKFQYRQSHTSPAPTRLLHDSLQLHVLVHSTVRSHSPPCASRLVSFISLSLLDRADACMHLLLSFARLQTSITSHKVDDAPSVLSTCRHACSPMSTRQYMMTSLYSSVISLHL